MLYNRSEHVFKIKILQSKSSVKNLLNLIVTVKNEIDKHCSVYCMNFNNITLNV